MINKEKFENILKEIVGCKIKDAWIKTEAGVTWFEIGLDNGKRLLFDSEDLDRDISLEDGKQNE